MKMRGVGGEEEEEEEHRVGFEFSPKNLKQAVFFGGEYYPFSVVAAAITARLGVLTPLSHFLLPLPANNTFHPRSTLPSPPPPRLHVASSRAVAAPAPLTTA